MSAISDQLEAQVSRLARMSVNGRGALTCGMIANFQPFSECSTRALVI